MFDSHPMCRECWEEKNPQREPVRIRDPELEMCCWCGLPTNEGIFVRADGKLLPTCPTKGEQKHT